MEVITHGNMDYAIARHYKAEKHSDLLGLRERNQTQEGFDSSASERKAFWMHELNTIELSKTHDLSCFL